MDEKLYLEIARKYGACGSWAIWADVGVTPKSNVGDLTVFDHIKNSELLKRLNPNVVMVELNISRRVETTFANFHDGSARSQDYKIRFAFKDTSFYGAYMTDIIKYLSYKDSREVVQYLKINPSVERENVSKSEDEMNDIGASDPLIIAFGNLAFNILDKYLGSRYKIVKLTDYSHQIGKENYRKEVENILAQI
ncbi:MAG: hypothetical protein ABI481_06825 [Pyrinomonadaceae bacterium]